MTSCLKLLRPVRRRLGSSMWEVSRSYARCSDRKQRRSTSQSTHGSRRSCRSLPSRVRTAGISRTSASCVAVLSPMMIGRRDSISVRHQLSSNYNQLPLIIIMNHNRFYFCDRAGKMCHHNRYSLYCIPCYVCNVVRRFSHIHRRVICS